MIQSRNIFIIALSLITYLANAQTKTVILNGGRAHIGTGKVIENAAIGFQNGKITFVADSKTIRFNPDEADIIDVTGKDIYPGFIGTCNTIGLTEVEAIRSTNDNQEVGGYTPHVRALVAFNAESKIIPTVRSNGILTVQSSPVGGIISGTSSVFKMDGWNWEDAVYKTDDGIHVNFPSWFSRTGWWAEPGGVDKNKEYDNQLRELRKFFADAKAYSATKQAEKNIRYEAMLGLFSGSKRLYISADYIKEIIEAVQLATDFGVKHIVIVGGRDAGKVTDLLKSKNVAVILNRLHELPTNTDSEIDQTYKQATALQKAGILFCLNYSGGMEAMGLRNLPFIAGTAAAYGINKEEALASISLNAAKILGVDATLGSLETGKDATLFVSKGDALDMMTNSVEKAYIQGKTIDLNNHQKELYEKYTKKLKN